jgi:hypothetical protein
MFDLPFDTQLHYHFAVEFCALSVTIFFGGPYRQIKSFSTNLFTTFCVTWAYELASTHFVNELSKSLHGPLAMPF